MQIMITGGTFVRTRVLNFRRRHVIPVLILLAALLMLGSGAIYHLVFLTAIRENWPVVSELVKLVIRDEIAQRERIMRENLDAMAERVGEMQAKVIKLEAMGERVSGMAGVKAEELQPTQGPRSAAKGNTGAKGVPQGQGGPYFPQLSPSLRELNEAVDRLEERAETGTDIFTLVESRLLEARLQSLLVPSTAPVRAILGSGFGFRPDPFTGRTALHTGQDFPVDVGTPIQAAAGGVVLATNHHPTYGNLLEIDHGNGLVTRYAHTSRILVKPGDLIKRGQVVAESGNSGRSTGPHLHFEVLVENVPQDPARFLAAKLGSVGVRTARR
jgi:murein DD-endopeptidase MepM/ murein hydrolase activator NlpD